MWDAYSSSRRRQRPIGFPPGVRDVHSAHPLRHATQVEKSSRGRLRPICCLAAPRAREARRRGSVRDGARDVKTVKPAVAAASCAVVALPRCSGDEGVSSGARERRAPDPREARGVGGAAAPHPAVVRPQELGAQAGRTSRRRACGRWKRDVRLALPPPARRAWRPMPSRRGLQVFGTCTY